MVTTKYEYTPGLEYMPGLLFEGRHLFLNPSKPPAAGFYSQGAFIQENIVYTALLRCNVPLTSILRVS